MKCPKCNGTGKVKLSYHVAIRYESDTSWEGPFPTKRAAKDRVKELNAKRGPMDGQASLHVQEEK